MQFWSGTAFLKTTEITAVAQLLDEAGFDGIMTADHLIYPRELTSPYPTPDAKPFWAPETAWPDSWVTIGAMAAVTTNLRFANSVYVAAARPLLEVAKQVATASVLSGGRVSLAVGVGWMREEFKLLGQDFDNRGPRTNEMIQALRALWQGGWVSWEGEYYRIPELMIEPHPPAPVPILCGGESAPALRRAAQYCDGWVGTAYAWDDAVAMIDRLQACRREYGRESEPFEIIIALLEQPSIDLYRRAEDIGVTAVMCAPWAGAEPATGSDRFRAPIERFADEIMAHCR
ncbi:MAG: TIGR03619 family F420-dependent LLM class oxidoreductase [Mycobacterium sp.]